MRVEVPFSLSVFRLHWVTALRDDRWVGSVAYSTLTGTLYDPIGLVGLNLVFMVQGLFFYQGLAVTHWSAKRKQARRAPSILMYLSIGDLSTVSGNPGSLGYLGELSQALRRRESRCWFGGRDLIRSD